MRTTEAANTSICAGLRLDGHARGVEGAAGVDPVGVADEALLAEGELLTAEPRDATGALRAADVGERLPQVERRRERRAGRADGLVADARVLQLDLAAHRLAASRWR